MTWGPSTGIGLNFQPRVYVVGKKTFLKPSEMPDIANADDLVTHSHRLHDLRGAPRTGQHTLSGGVRTTPSPVQDVWFGLFVGHISTTKRKHQLVSTA